MREGELQVVQPLTDPGPGRNVLKPRARLKSTARALSLNGLWSFRWLAQQPQRDAAPSFEAGQGEQIPVPASFVMPHLDNFLTQPHGTPWYTNVRYPFPVDPPFPPDANPAGEYEREVVWQNPPARAYLRFDGIEGAADIWWNGHYLGSTRVSRLPSEFDVSGLVTGHDRLAVRVHQFSAASYLEDQDEWWLPGIIREVSLIERPAQSIEDVAVSASWVGGKARLKASVRLGAGVAAESLRAQLVETGLEIAIGGEVEVGDVSPWSAESPSRYTLRVTVGEPEVDGESVEVKFGFRSVSIEDGVFMVNGSPVQMRGVNRHEHHPLWGRAVPADTVRAELLLMKQHNINAIRTSHYPSDSLMLDLADELGFWVVDECDFETHGFGMVGWRGNPTADPQWRNALVERAQRMVERDKNHPCIVMWSLGNEAWEGENLGAMASAIRAIDGSRPIHYEGDLSCQFVDVYSRMYASVAEVELIGQRAEPPIEPAELDARRRAMPFVLCEYAHAMGTGPGGLTEYQELFDKYPRNMGGFVWEWLEHGIYVERDGQLVTVYGGDFGEPVHDGNFVIDGLVAASREPRAQLRDLAAVFAPFILKIDDAGQLTVTSRLDHIDSAKFEFAWQVEDSSGIVQQGIIDVTPLAPRASERIQLDSAILQLLGSGARVLTVAVRLRENWCGLAAGWQVAQAQLIGNSSTYLMRSSQTPDSGEAERLTDLMEFSEVHGGPVRIGDLEVQDWALDLWRAPTDNDRGREWFEPDSRAMAERWEEVGLNRLVSRLESMEFVGGNGLLVKTRVSSAGSDIGVSCSWQWQLLAGGVQLKLNVTPFGEWPEAWSSHWARTAVTFGILAPNSTTVEWFGRGPGPAYPDTGQAAHFGWHEATISGLQERTVRPQESSRRADVLSAQIGNLMALESESGFGLTIRPWSPAVVAATTHDHLLPQSNSAHIAIDFACSGVGTAACGPGVLPAYRLPAREVSGSVTFFPISNLRSEK